MVALATPRRAITLLERLRRAVVKPPGPGETPATARPRPVLPVEDLHAAARSADDKERLVGLITAPLAAAISILVVSALISNDPAALLRNGQVNRLHVSTLLYESLAGVLLALSVLMLATALTRRRILLGIVIALYGLAIFNLHYWGFGIPFIMGGAWLLVRAYRLQADLREATNEAPARVAGSAPRRSAPSYQGPGPSRRYTQPSSTRRRR